MTHQWLSTYSPNSFQRMRLQPTEYSVHTPGQWQYNHRHLVHGRYVAFANAVQNRLYRAVLRPLHSAQPPIHSDATPQTLLHRNHLN